MLREVSSAHPVVAVVLIAFLPLDHRRSRMVSLIAEAPIKGACQPG
jgi:hypothetical protein